MQVAPRRSSQHSASMRLPKASSPPCVHSSRRMTHSMLHQARKFQHRPLSFHCVSASSLHLLSFSKGGLSNTRPSPLGKRSSPSAYNSEETRSAKTYSARSRCNANSFSTSGCLVPSRLSFPASNGNRLSPPALCGSSPSYPHWIPPSFEPMLPNHSLVPTRLPPQGGRALASRLRGHRIEVVPAPPRGTVR